MKKKNFLLAVLALTFLATSCATYQCPTYSKDNSRKDAKVSQRTQI